MIQKMKLNIIISTLILFILIALILLTIYHSSQKGKIYNGLFVRAWEECKNGCLYTTETESGFA